MRLKGGFSFKVGDISLCLNGSGGSPGKRKNDETGKRLENAREISLNEKEEFQC